jgi:hypothetical protein
MNGAAPPPTVPAPHLGPLALNLRNQMLRKNTNKRLAALNSIGVSPAEQEPTQKNLPRLSNLAPFPVPELILAPPSRLSAKASNWAPSPPPLPPGPPPLSLVPPPGLPPLPYMASYVPTPSGPPPLPPGPPPMTSYVPTPSTMPNFTPPSLQLSLSPKMLIEYMLEGGRVYINNYPAHLQTELKALMQHYRFEYSISMHYRDGNSLSTNPYFFISKKVNRPPMHSVGQTKRHRRNKKRLQTRRHR